MRPQNAAEVLLILEDVVIVGRPLAARTGFRCGFEDEHGDCFKKRGERGSGDFRANEDLILSAVHYIIAEVIVAQLFFAHPFPVAQN